MLELFFAPGACSFVPHVALERIHQSTGVDFTPMLIKLHRNENHTPEFLALNPEGQVPVLRESGDVITQIVAICEHLDRSAPSLQLLPSQGLARSRALSSLVWINNTVHPTFTHFFMPAKFTDDPAAQAAIRQFNAVKYRKHLESIQAQLPASGSWGRPGLEGVGFLDAYALTLWRWGGFTGIAPESLPAYRLFVDRIALDPAVAAVVERERITLHTYKAPA